MKILKRVLIGLSIVFIAIQIVRPARYDAKRAAHKLEEICEQVEQGKMPIKNYVLLHPAASLSAEDRQAICDWAKQERERVIAGQQTGAH